MQQALSSHFSTPIIVVFAAVAAAAASQVEEASQINRLGFPIDSIVQHKLLLRKNDYYECFEEMNKVLRRCSNVLEKVPWEIKPMIQVNSWCFYMHICNKSFVSSRFPLLLSFRDVWL